MKIKYLLFVTVFSASFSTMAAEDCNPNFDPYCGDSKGYGSLDAAVAVLLVGSAAAVGVGLYFIFKDDNEDPEVAAKIMADYYKGKGLRLTSYENTFNVSLFTPKPYISNDPLTNLTNQYKLHEQTYNLVNISVHWQ